MKDDIQKTALRLPRELHTAIHEAARSSGRTMNAEIVYRLQQSFEIEGAGMPPSNLSRDKLLKALNEMIKHLEEDK